MSDDLDAPLPPGNASHEAKQHVVGVLAFIAGDAQGFVIDVCRRIQVTEVSVVPKSEAPKREEVVVVCELDVEQGALLLMLRCSVLK
jgi:hypothetical protein